MTIDVNILRVEKGGNPDLVRQSERDRGRDPALVDRVIEIDNEWRKAMYEMEQLKKNLNVLSKEIGICLKRKEECPEKIKESQDMKKELPHMESLATIKAEERDTLLHKIGNLLHPSVRVSHDEADNPTVRVWGKPRTIKCDGTRGRMHHHQILLLLGGYDPKRGVEIAGHRGYFLKGIGVMLNMALIQYGLKFLYRKGFIPLQPPYFMRKEVMSKTAELKDFDETLYKIPMGYNSSAAGAAVDCPGADAGGGGDRQSAVLPSGSKLAEGTSEDGRDDLYLIATSEQPISAFHMGEWMEPSELPVKYAGVSSCFRKEAGSHGKDCWGIFRVHQFEKVEQFVITAPDMSTEMHEEMIDTCEEFYQSLNLPYRIRSIVSTALNDAAVKKYDLEAWFPGYEDFRELVSCSNCTDYQSRKLDIRFGHKKMGSKEKEYVHMLNATMCATERCLCCILENYQTEDGITVPEVLVPFMPNGQTHVPFPDVPPGHLSAQ